MGDSVWDARAPNRSQPPVTTTPSVPGPQPDGLVEHADSPGRQRLTWQEMRAMAPERVGPVVLPGYGTQLIRLTDRGLVHPNGMAYHSNVNNHAGLPTLHVLVSVDDVLCVLPVDKASGYPGAPMPTSFRGTGEGSYWSWTQPNLFYLPQGATLMAFDINTWTSHVVLQAPGEIRQAHSSADGQVHSFTLNGQPAVVVHGRLHPLSARDFDECQIDKSGRWLLIKHGPRLNTVVDVVTGREWSITAAEGSVGHSDMGWGYMIGEDNQTNPGGVFRRWDFTEDGPVDRGPVWHVGGWSPMTRYVSCNARAGGPALFSGATNDDRARANELVSVPLDGSQVGRVLCPNLTHVVVKDDGSLEYWSITRANLDPTGEYACFGGNLGGERGDLFLVKVAA